VRDNGATEGKVRFADSETRSRYGADAPCQTDHTVLYMRCRGREEINSPKSKHRGRVRACAERQASLHTARERPNGLVTVAKYGIKSPL
jgi:hypothetical protein